MRHDKPAYTSVSHVPDEYVQRVRELPYVQQVLLSKLGKRYRIYTVIDAPFSNFKQVHPISQAQQAVLLGRYHITVDFLLVNQTTDQVRALPYVPDSEPRQLSKDARLLFDRKQAA